MHLTSQCCATTIETLTGVTYLNVLLGFSIKEGGNHARMEIRPLMDVLMSVDVDGKPLIHVVADGRRGTTHSW